MANTRFNVTVSDELLSRLDKIASEIGVTRNALCAMIIKGYVDQQDTLRMSRQVEMLNAAQITNIVK